MTDEDEDDCGCEWHPTCEGSGMYYCLGCGGDLCVCLCGGERECQGCADCREPVDQDD